MARDGEEAVLRSEETAALVSVVVPTRNRRPLLQQLLAALDEQEYPRYEVVVVDDASSDGTEESLAAWRGEEKRTLRLDTPSGSYAARNAGWRSARGSIVAFTDDDCLPHPQWLSRLVTVLRSSDTVAVQGVTIAGPGEITPFTHQIEQRRPGPPYRTCNMAYRRSVLEQLGGFEDSLRWYADNILGFHARRLGEIAFAPDAVVYHPPRPREWRDRATWRARFAADAAHRRELQRLDVEPAVVPARVLPVLLWVLRPLLKQSLAHLRYLSLHPRGYIREVRPMLREKRELLAALFSRSPVPVGALQMGSGEGTADLPLLPLVSVVVVTRNRPQLLDEALTALEGQTYRRHELVVADNGRGGEARAVAERHGARYVATPGVTLGRARQAGVLAARGEIVAFTDDDCLADPNWVQAIVDAFRRQPWLRGVQGRTRAERGPIGSHAVRVPRRNTLYQTCNMAYRREVLTRAGGFDPRFEGWFEDTTLAARVLAHGPIGFEERAVVTHRAMPRRPLDRSRWRIVLRDERRMAREYRDFYRRTRGWNVTLTVIVRWLLGSPAKALIRELPRAPAEPGAYLAFARVLLRERWELLHALLHSTVESGHFPHGE